MPSLDCGIAGGGGGGNGNGGLTRETVVDFRTIGTDTFVAADNGVEQDVGGYKFEPYGIVAGNLSLDATYGMSGTDANGTLAWYPSRGAEAIDLTGKQQIFLVCKVWEANTWSGQAGIQCGDGDGAGSATFNYGADALRTNSTQYQGARRSTLVSSTNGAVPLPTAPGGVTVLLISINRTGMSCWFRQDIGIDDALPAPDDVGWVDADRRPAAGINFANDDGQDWEDQTEFHVSCWHTGHTPVGQYYSLIECGIWSSELKS